MRWGAHAVMKHVDSSNLPWTIFSFFKHFIARSFLPFIRLKTVMNNIPPRHAEVLKKAPEELPMPQARLSTIVNSIPLWTQPLSTAGLPSCLSWDFLICATWTLAQAAQGASQASHCTEVALESSS